MPRSSSSFAAFSISGMSLLEPMTMPTRGVSTSSPSKSGSTWVSVSGAEGWPSVIPVASPPPLALALAHEHGAARDVSSQLLPLESDHVGGSIRGVPGGGGVLAEGRDVEHAAAGGHDLAALAGGSRVRHLDVGSHPVETRDHVALRRGLGIARAGEHHGHGPALVPAQLGSGQAAGLGGG